MCFLLCGSWLEHWVAGKITLPSTILQFWDLGGQRGIRSIWPRYYDDCHAVAFVIDAEDRERLGEGWDVFGRSPYGPRSPAKAHAQRRKIAFSRRPRYLESRSCFLPTSRTRLIVSAWRKFAKTMRHGTSERLRALGAGMAALLTSMKLGESVLPASMSWASLHSKGPSPTSLFKE